MTDISSPLDSIFKIKEIKEECDGLDIEKSYTVDDIVVMLSNFGEQLTSKGNDRKCEKSENEVEYDRNVRNNDKDTCDSIRTKINVKNIKSEDVDLAEYLDGLKIVEDVHEKKAEESSTKNDIDADETEFIPRGKGRVKIPFKSPYDRPNVYNSYASTSFTDNSTMNYNLHGYGFDHTCNFVKHVEGLSGGLVMTKQTYYEPVYMPPQLVHAKVVAEEYPPPINCYDANLYMKVESPQTMSALTQIPNYCLSPPLSIPDHMSKYNCDNPPNVDLHSCLNSPPSVGRFPGVDPENELDVGEGVSSMVDIFLKGYETPPQDEDPLDDIIVKEQDGEIVLGVRNDLDKRIHKRYIETVARDVANQSEDQEEELKAHRLIASIPGQALIKLDENQNSLIMDLINTGFRRAGFKALLDRYQRNGLLSEFINKKNKCRRTPLHFAVHHKEVEKTRLLVERGADVNVSVFTPYPGERKCKKESLIGHYSSKGQEFLSVFIELLCSPDANVNYDDSDGYAPLHSAILSHDIDGINSKVIIYHVILRGADINMKNTMDSRTPLYCAIQRGYHLVDYLFQVVKAVYPSDYPSKIKSMVQPGFTMLKLAYDLYAIDPITKVKLINLLLEHGAELTQKSQDIALRKALLNLPGIEGKLLAKVRK